MKKLGCSLLLVVIFSYIGARQVSAQGEKAFASSPEELLTQARTAEADKQYVQASVAYRQYLTVKPEDDEVRAALARVLSWQSQFDDAVELYEEILRRYPEDLDIRVALARVKSWQHDFAEAQALYEEILHRDPTCLDAKRGLADTLYWNGEDELALRLYEEVLAAIPDPELAQRIEMIKARLSLSLQTLANDIDAAAGLYSRDNVRIGYSHFTYTKGIPDEQIWQLEGVKHLGKQTFVGRVEAWDRFGLHDTLVSAEIYSSLWKKAWGDISVAFGIDPQFTPRWVLGGEIFQSLGLFHPRLTFFELSGGYRHMSFQKTDVDLFFPGLTIYLPRDVWLTEKVYLFPRAGSLTLSSRLDWRVNDRLQLFASGAFGDSGERLATAADFVSINTRTLSAGIEFPLTRHLSVETWVYHEDREKRYTRRGGVFNLIFYW